MVTREWDSSEEAVIVKGPSGVGLVTALLTGGCIFFRFRDHNNDTPVRVWSIRCHDSGRQYWTIDGTVDDGTPAGIGCTATYWIRGEECGGILKASLFSL
jgi:hypothetical protein